MSKFKSKALRLSALCTVSALAFAAQGIATAQTSDTVQTDVQTQDFDIPAQPLGRALAQFGEQADVMIFAAADQTRGKTSAPVSGSMTSYAALSGLLQGTSLEPAIQADGSFAIAQATPPTEENDDTPVETQQAEVDESEGNGEPAERQVVTLEELRDREVIEADEEAAKENRGLADFVVMDTITVRGRNVGVRRFEDDPQPYVIFNSDDIENSLATNLEDFLRTRLPQNTQPGSARQFQAAGDQLGNVSTIDLRGLGQDETLILVNGRRAPRVSLGNDFRQADINGIPLGSIERIEILPSTASGIYGGSATGGVINIITRRDFVGGEVFASYNNTFDTDVGQRSISGTFGFSLEDGRTNVQLSASYSDANELVVGDRDFARKSRDLLLRNDPSALGGISTTPNIFSRRGENLVLDDGTDLGSDRTFVPAGYTGPASDAGLALFENAGLFNTELPPGVNGADARLIQAPTTESYSATVRRDFGRGVEGYLEATYSTNEGETQSPVLLSSDVVRATNPTNPFQNDIRVVVNNPLGDTFLTQNSSDTTQIVTGFNWNFAPRWVANVDYSWSLSSFESVSDGFPFNTNAIRSDIASGQIDLFRDLSEDPIDFSPYRYETPFGILLPRENELTNLALRVSGSHFDLPAGPVNFSFLAETRESQIKGSLDDSIIANSPVPGERQITFTPPRSQGVDSLYAEALVPLFSESYSLPFVKELDLQVSVRYDDYESTSPDVNARAVLSSRSETPPEFDTFTNEFDSFDYTVGLRYKPIDDLLLRASFATGFVPPNVTQIFPIERTNLPAVVADPQRGGFPSFFFVPDAVSGGRDTLRPEESESWSAGAIVTPSWIPGFRLSVDYTLIEKEGEIGALNIQELVDLEDLFPDRIQRAPLTDADQTAGFTGGAITFVDLTLLNLELTTSESVDIQVDQLLETENWGEFRLYAIGTFTDRVERQIIPETPLVDRVGFDDGPLEWRANFGVTWNSPQENLSIGWNAQFYDSYLVYGVSDRDRVVEEEILQHGRTTIPSQMFHDLSLTYRPDVEGFGGVLDGTEFRLGIQNIFDEEPFIRPDAQSRGRYSSYGDPRLRRYSISVRKSF